MTKRIQLGSGDVLENKRFDGDGIQIIARGRNWAIRNVVVKNNGATTPFRVVDTGGSSLIENVFVDGVDENAFFGNAISSGHIDVRHVHVRNIGGGEDAFYFSPMSNDDTDLWHRKTGKDRGRGGTADFFRCFGENIEGYFIRQGGPTSVVKECVGKNCKVPFATLYGQGNNGRTGKPVYYKDCAGSGYETGLRVGTHVDRNQPWNSNDVIAVADNVQIEMSRGERFQRNEHGWRTHRNPVTELRGEVGSNPDLSIPEWCPHNANDVFDDDRQAGQNNASAGDDWHHIVVDASRTDGSVGYELDCSASEVRMGDKADPQESIDGRIVTGQAGDGVDDFYVESSERPHLNSAVVNGSPTDLWRVKIFVDGQAVAFSGVAKTPRDHEIVVDGRDAGRTDYWIVVSEGADAHDRDPATINGNDQAVQAGPDGECVVSGRVYGGVDGWDTDGIVLGVVLDGPGAGDVAVRFDGQLAE